MSRCFFNFESWSSKWVSFINFVNVHFNADFRKSTSAFRTLCLNETSFFLSFSTSCNIFIVKTHFSIRKSTLSLNVLIWVRSNNWQMILIVEFAVDKLTFNHFSTIVSFQVVITFSHLIVSIIRSKFLVRFSQYCLNLSYLCVMNWHVTN